MLPAPLQCATYKEFADMMQSVTEAQSTGFGIV